MKTQPLGAKAVRIAIKRGRVDYNLAGTSELLAAKAEGWIRKDKRCKQATYRVTSKGRAAFPELSKRV